VSDCGGGTFNIRDTKTKAGERRVPIHAHLRPIVAARLKGKQPDAFLFDELKASPGRERERTAKASERFTEYRRAIGIDERDETQRQANADFHSFRRWFITKAEQAGQPPHIISAVAGHAEGRQGMTLGRYSKGPSEEQLRAVVESVQLPEGAPLESPGGTRMGDRKGRPASR
jgi:integrase